MPQNVQMPDGTIVAMPDNPTPEELSALQSIISESTQAAPAEDNSLRQTFKNAAETIEKPIQSFVSSVESVGRGIKDIVGTGEDVLRTSPGEMAGQSEGTLAGARLGASIPGPLPLKAIGALAGGFAGGGYGGTLGAELDELMGKFTKGFVGQATDQEFGDNLQQAFENQIIGSALGTVGVAADRAFGALSKTEAFKNFVTSAIEKANYLPTAVKDRVLPMLDRAKNATEIVEGTFNNPITGDEYVVNARDAAKRLSNGMELPVPYETGGKLMANKAKDLADQGPQNALADYMDAFGAKVRLQADKIISGGYTPAATAGVVKDSIKAYDKMLSEPLNQAEKMLLKHANTQVSDNVIKKNLAASINPEVNAVAQQIDPVTLGKFEKAINALPANATVTDLRQFNAKLKTISGELNPRDVGNADKLVGDIKKNLEAQLSMKLGQLSNKGEYAKKVEALGALKAYNTAAEGKAKALTANKFFDQIGVKDIAQQDIKLTDDAVINKLFENYENYAGFKKMIQSLPPQANGAKALQAVEDSFRYKIRQSLTEDADGVIGGADKILRRGGGLSAVPQDRLISEAAGPEVLKYLQDLSVLNKALGRRAVGGGAGVNPAVRSSLGGLSLSAAVSTADAQKLLVRMDKKLALGIGDKVLKAMTDPKMKDTFYRLATTPLVSPQSYSTYVAAMSALGVAIDTSKEEFEHNARALDDMVKAQNNAN